MDDDGKRKVEGPDVPVSGGDPRKDKRYHPFVFGFGGLGLLVGAAFGFLLGWFAYPQFFPPPTGAAQTKSQEMDAAQILLVWLFAIIGTFAGSGQGRSLLLQKRKQERSRARKIKYAAQIERYEQEKAEEAAKPTPPSRSRP